MTRPFDPAKLDGGIKAYALDESSGLSAEARQMLDEAAKCATAVGNLCFAWSVLEGKFDSFTEVVLSCPVEGVPDAMLAIIPAGDKTRIALALGNLSRLSDEWFEVLKWCIAKTDGDLRSRRNRVVHDPLWAGSDGIKRVQRKTAPNSGDFSVVTQHTLDPHICAPPLHSQPTLD